MIYIYEGAYSRKYVPSKKLIKNKVNQISKVNVNYFFLFCLVIFN